MLELDRLLETVEERLAAAEDAGGDDDGQLVHEVCLERLTDHVGAAHDVDVLVARGLPRCLDRLGNPLDEAERIAFQLLVRPVGDDEASLPRSRRFTLG